MKRAGHIRDVWASNLEQEMILLSELIDDYDYIAIDTEFPGVVVRLMANEGTDANYQTLRHNVDILKVIQVGLSISNADGQSPKEGATWQFNFSFSLAQDIYAQDSIDLLTTSGIDFSAHERDGIDVLTFGELLTSSGIVLNDRMKWVSFHGSYDFAYLYKLLMAEPLPKSESEFFEMLALFFPTMYDLKTLIRQSDNLFGGLNKVATQLGCERIGSMHQAGSDSLLTLDVFMRLRDTIFHGLIDESRSNVLYGLGPNSKVSPVYSPSKGSASVAPENGAGGPVSSPLPTPTLLSSP